MGPNSTAVDTNRITVPDRRHLQLATQLFIASPPRLSHSSTGQHNRNIRSIPDVEQPTESIEQTVGRSIARFVA